jgi:hypothetical protein
MNQTYDEEENDENPQSNPNKDIVNNIYDEIEKDVEVIKSVVIIVDQKLFSNRWGCFFYSFF